MDPCSPSDCDLLNHPRSDGDMFDGVSDEALLMMDEPSSAVAVLLHLATGLARWANDNSPLEIERMRDLLDSLRKSMDEKSYSKEGFLNPRVSTSVFKSFEEIVFHSNEHFLANSSTTGMQPLIRNITTPSRYVAALLQCALENNIPNILSLFAAHDIDVAAADSFGITPLMWACGAAFYGNRERVETSLYFPPRPGNVRLVSLLLNLDHNPNTDAGAHADTHATISLTDTNISNAMQRPRIGTGIDINVIDEDSMSALMYASVANHVDVMRILIQAGADLTCESSWGDAALTLATCFGNLEAVGILLSSGANTEHRDQYNHTPLVNAIIYGHPQIFFRLLGTGSTLRQRHYHARTSLHLAARSGNTKLLRMFIPDSGFSPESNVDDRDKSGQTALIFAAMYGRLECVKILLDAKADVNGQDREGLTPLSWAAMFGKVPVMKELIGRGANVHLRDNVGQTALMHMSRGFGDNSAATIQVLMDAGLHLEEVDNFGRTALICAVGKHVSQNVISLLRARARVDVEMDGKTVLELIMHAQLDTALKPLLESAQMQFAVVGASAAGDQVPCPGKGVYTGSGTDEIEDDDIEGGGASVGKKNDDNNDDSDVDSEDGDDGADAGTGTGTGVRAGAGHSSGAAVPGEAVAMLDVAQYTKMAAMLLLRVFHRCGGRTQTIVGAGSGMSACMDGGKRGSRTDSSSVDVPLLIAALFGILDDISHSRSFPTSLLTAFCGNPDNPEFFNPKYIPAVGGGSDGVGDGTSHVNASARDLRLSRAHQAIAEHYRVLVAAASGHGKEVATTTGRNGDGGSGHYGGGAGDCDGKAVLRTMTETVLALVRAAAPFTQAGCDTRATTSAVVEAGGVSDNYYYDSTDKADGDSDMVCPDLAMANVYGGVSGVLNRDGDVVGQHDITHTRYLAFLLQAVYLCHRCYDATLREGQSVDSGTCASAENRNSVAANIEMNIMAVFSSLYQCISRHVEAKEEGADEDAEEAGAEQEERVGPEVTVDMQDGRGRTVLMWIATMALQPNTRDSHFGNHDSAHRDVVRVCSPPFPSTYRISIPLLRALIHAGADINIRDKDGKTALMYACIYNHVCMVSEVIAAGSNANMCDKNGATALMYACKYHSVESVHTLCMLCARTTLVDDNGYSALMYAALSGCKEAFQEILAVKTDLPCSLDDGVAQMLLFCAIKGGNIDIVRICLPPVLTVINDVDEDGKTALDIALMMNNSEIVQLLIDAGASVSEEYEDQ